MRACWDLSKIGKQMPNDPRASVGVAILTTFVHGDHKGFNAVTGDLAGGCPEAVAALGRVAEAMVSMIADLLSVTKEEALERVAAAIAAG
jgi:hypothetical protein